jgi:hypothetical protein
MNAGPADTRSPHLDVGDLIAEVTGQPVDDRAREHLAHCEHCRAEATRWDLVGAGVRGLAATAPQPAQPARPARPRHTRLRVPAGLGRRAVLAVGVAAALVLASAIGYEASKLVHISFGTSGTSAGPVLTAVSGCSALEEASGTLEQVNGGSLVIKTASGQPVTVTTTASTFLAMSGPLRSDITDGASVTVGGASSDGTISALFVNVGNPAHSHPQVPSGIVVVKGTVSGASAAGFTVVTSGGTLVPVTTSSDTVVNIPNTRPDQLPIGASAFALGHAGSDGTLSARAVAVIQPVQEGNIHTNLQVHVKNCSAASIDNAFAFGG